MTGSSTPEIEIHLSQAEALVLFEWLSREDEAGLLSIVHPSEQRVLWSLEGKLEKALPVFSTEYLMLVENARLELGRE